MGGSIIRVKRAKMPPRADVICPVCAAPKRYPCKSYNEKRRRMVALPKIHAERAVLQQQWLKDRRERRAAAGTPGPDTNSVSSSEETVR